MEPYTRKIFISIFEFFGQFYFQIDVFKLEEIFPELGILENGIYYRIGRGAKKVLKTRLKTKETMHTLVFLEKKTLLSLFGATQ
jgi:hypothetical protein